jgi:hypothetical protein
LALRPLELIPKGEHHVRNVSKELLNEAFQACDCAGRARQPTTYGKRVVSVGNGELTFTENDAATPVTYAVADDVTVTRDNVAATVSDVQSGDMISITTDVVDGRTLITSIDAVSGEPADVDVDSDVDTGTDLAPPIDSDNLTPEEGDAGIEAPTDPLIDQPTDSQEPSDLGTVQPEQTLIVGTVKTVEADKVVITDEAAQEHTFMVTPETTVTESGQTTDVGQVQVGDSVQITVSPEEEGVAMTIEVKSAE